MLYCDTIDVSEGIDTNKTNASKECNIFHYCYFFGKGFKFPLDVGNGCPDVVMMSMNLSNIAILNTNGADYHCVQHVSRSSNLNQQSIWQRMLHKNFLSLIIAFSVFLGVMMFVLLCALLSKAATGNCSVKKMF